MSWCTCVYDKSIKLLNVSNTELKRYITFLFLQIFHYMCTFILNYCIFLPFNLSHFLTFLSITSPNFSFYLLHFLTFLFIHYIFLLFISSITFPYLSFNLLLFLTFLFLTFPYLFIHFLTYLFIYALHFLFYLLHFLTLFSFIAVFLPFFFYLLPDAVIYYIEFVNKKTLDNCFILFKE